MSDTERHQCAESVSCRVVTLIFPCVLLLFAIGCGPALHVTREGKTVAGIPFYVKEAQCLHQMVYIVPYYRLTLQTTNNGTVEGSDTMTISERDYLNNITVSNLLSLMHKGPQLSNSDFKTVAQDWSDLRTKHSADPYDAAEHNQWPEYLISNSMTPKIFVDYGVPYTLDSKSPLAGSVNADYKLAGDGTLTESSAQVNNQTLSTILSVLPISDLMKTAASGTFAVETNKAPAPSQIGVQLTADRFAIKITDSQSVPFAPGCPDENNFKKDTPVGILVEDVGAESPSSQSKSDDNSIAITGKILLPKPKESPPVSKH